MSKPKLTPAMLDQLEQVLEERDNKQDRRKAQNNLPEGVAQDRRKGDRRASRTLKH